MRHRGRLRPLTPILNNELRRGGIAAGNTPSPPVALPVIAIGREHQGAPLYQAKGICIANSALVVASYFSNYAVTLSLDATPSILGSVYDVTNLGNVDGIAKISDSYVLLGGTGGFTTVDISNTASLAVEDNVAGGGEVQAIVIDGTTAHGFSGGGGWAIGEINASDPTAISYSSGPNNLEHFVCFDRDTVDDIYFFGEAGSPANLVTYKSGSEVDSESLGGTGTPIEVVHDPDTNVVAVVWVDGGDNTHVTTFTYDTSGNLTAGGTVSSGDGAGTIQQGCAVRVGSGVHAFVGSGYFQPCKHYLFDITTPGAPTCSIQADVNGPTSNPLVVPHQAVSDGTRIYVTDEYDLI